VSYLNAMGIQTFRGSCARRRPLSANVIDRHVKPRFYYPRAGFKKVIGR
jgi:hypothetical protein